VWRLAEANQAGNVSHRNRRLLDQQLRAHVQPPCLQVLAKGALAELLVDAAQLSGRAGQRPRDACQRQRPAVVARDDQPCL
jgi:hypothetical protein